MIVRLADKTALFALIAVLQGAKKFFAVGETIGFEKKAKKHCTIGRNRFVLIAARVPYELPELKPLAQPDHRERVPLTALGSRNAASIKLNGGRVCRVGKSVGIGRNSLARLLASWRLVN